MSSQPLVLAIEPDMRQAAILKRIVKERVLADVAVVDSRDAAIESIRTAMPDVLLLSALLSPRDEDELIAHLRTLDNAGHLQTHTIPQLASALGPSEGRSRGLFSAFRRKKESEPAVVAGCDPDLFAEEIRLFLQHAEERKRELERSGPSVGPVRAAKADREKKNQEPVDQPEDSSGSSSWESPFEWKPTGSRTSRPAPPPPPAPEPFAPTPMAQEPFEPAGDIAFVPEPMAAEPLAAEPTIIEPLTHEAPIVEPLVADPIFAEQPIADTPLASEVMAAAVEPVPPPAPTPLVSERVGKVIGEAPIIVESSDPWVVHAPRLVTIETPAMEPVLATPLVDTLPEVEAALEPEPVYAASAEPVVIERDPAPAEPPPAPVHERAVKIVARVQEEAPARREHLLATGAEWTRPQPSTEGITDRLGPLARWARSEPVRKPKAAAVTADDVRALIASLAVPTSVASVTYPKGCRIRRVRVPAAPDADSSDSVGAVILSKRALAERRDKHTTA